jgi:hypothetical protein
MAFTVLRTAFVYYPVRGVINNVLILPFLLIPVNRI